MSKFTGATVKPIGQLRVKDITPPKAFLQSPRDLVRIAALAPDLFRLRIARGENFGQHRSWAVINTDWPAHKTDIHHTGNEITLTTTKGKLTFNLKTGDWSLSDASGHTAFESSPGSTGFQVTKAGITLNLAENESLFGLGETTGTYNKRGLIRELWNIDVLGHTKSIYPSLRSLYVSIPFVVSLRNGRAAGLFWDNPARQLWDMGQTKLDKWQMTAASGEIDLYLFLGPQVSNVVSRYTELTGRIPLPPLWALGYQQCRYSYETAKRAEEVAKDFRSKKIPCDVIYLDIHHMDGYRVFTFGKTYPKPRQLISKLAKQGFKVVAIVDPGVKDDPNFGVLKRGIELNAYVKDPQGKKDYIGRVWPGRARFPDFLRQNVREWWGREQARLQALGVAGFWNDMNEPANFALPTKTLPEGCPHNTDFGLMHHSEAHNLYGMQMARASREGALAHQPDQRPFIISRAGYAGVQRYAMVWTGDNSSVWDHLNDAIQMFLNLSISGLAFCGGDVGGFLDNCTPELLVRWIQMATFTPFFRNHTNTKTIDQEPWAFGSKVEAICRSYIELRYQLLPYLYNLFVEAHRNGTPIMRPLFWHYQEDPIATACGDQFLLGKDLLVAPIVHQGAVARSVYLPPGEWFNFWTGEKHIGGRHIVAEAPLEKIPLYIRAGAIVPMAAVRQYVGQKPVHTMNLHIWPGESDTLNWYEDDGTSMNYTKGDTLDRQVTASLKRTGGTIHFSAPTGKRSSKIKTWRIILRASPKHFRIKVNNRTVKSHFDRLTNLCSFEIPNTNSETEIKLT